MPSYGAIFRSEAGTAMMCQPHFHAAQHIQQQPHPLPDMVPGVAPLVNVLITMTLHSPKNPPSPFLFLGFLFTAAGAGMVLYLKPAA